MLGKPRKGTKVVKLEKVSLDINKLYEGKVFKNHRLLCEELGWEYKDSTDSKKAQLKVLSQYCEWHKEGHKIIVDKVYKSQAVAQKNVRLTESKLIKLGVQYNILNIMLSNLSKEDVEALNEGQEDGLLHTNYFVIPTLQKATGLVGDYYYVSRHHQEQIAQIEGIPVEEVNDFFYCTHKKMNRYIDESLKELKNKRLLTYSETKKLTFARVVLSPHDFKILQQGKHVKTERVYSQSYATKGQLGFIAKCERQAMERFGLTTFNQIYGRSNKERKKFFSHCNKLIRDNAQAYATTSGDDSIAELIHLHKYAKCYEIMFIPSWIQKEMKRIDKQLKEKAGFIELLNSHTFEGVCHLPVGEDVREYVNDKNVKSLKKNIQSRHRNAEDDSCRASEEYVSNGHTLVDNYVSRSCEGVRTKLEEYGLIQEPNFKVNNVVTVGITEVEQQSA